MIRWLAIVFLGLGSVAIAHASEEADAASSPFPLWDGYVIVRAMMSADGFYVCGLDERIQPSVVRNGKPNCVKSFQGTDRRPAERVSLQELLDREIPNAVAIGTLPILNEGARWNQYDRSRTMILFKSRP